MKGEKTALLVVDVQNVAFRYDPWRGEEVVRNIATMVRACRDAGVEVIYVQHDGEPGGESEPGSEGWKICPAVAPESGEKVIRKRFNSAFRETELDAYLAERGIGTLILVGIQTEYCVDTTARVAFELGYRLVMPEMTNTSFDNGELTGEQIVRHWNRHIFAGRFAEVVGIEEVVRRLG